MPANIMKAYVVAATGNGPLVNLPPTFWATCEAGLTSRLPGHALPGILSGRDVKTGGWRTADLTILFSSPLNFALDHRLDYVAAPRKANRRRR